MKTTQQKSIFRSTPGAGLDILQLMNSMISPTSGVICPRSAATHTQLGAFSFWLFLPVSSAL
jgi:hypothetical protein